MKLQNALFSENWFIQFFIAYCYLVFLSLNMGQPRPLFVLLSSFSQYNDKNGSKCDYLYKSIAGVLDIQTWDIRMGGADESTDQWQPHLFLFLEYFFQIWANLGLFLFIFVIFSLHLQFQQIEKSIDGELGIWTRGCRMVGADDTTELWQPPGIKKIWEWRRWQWWISIFSLTIFFHSINLTSYQNIEIEIINHRL